MAGFGAKTGLEEEPGLLIARGELDWQSEEEFLAAGRRLLECDLQALVVDLRGCSGISSAIMSLLVNLHYWASDQGKQLRFRVGPEVAKVFDRTRLSDLVGMDIERTGPEQE